ncbi:hypothetical protein CVD28_01465 [Bacillus sp. M6-12]|uniref:hypothetical protein n=1 Tax=Bacillus sp. M6-12 TaxID=2054166 RepID=UPI000C78939F|nr:hypothetical protein [Bacillus sp. M6-12]PLS19103.1 hypothetical protein CVD28_01465 [Bacillus sp. M6-12]
MKLKITIDAGEVGFWEVDTVTDYYEEMKEVRGEEHATSFFRSGVFEGEEIESHNGKHYIYGYLEGLYQSDRCPHFLYDAEIKQITVEVLKEVSTLVKCKNCRHCGFDFEDFFHPSYKCKKEKQNLKEVENMEDYEIECDAFKSKYIEYPLTIEGIDKPKNKGIEPYFGKEIGTLVKIRPCTEKYGNKTYLGLLLGDVDLGLMISHNESTNRMEIYRHFNPAIFVPELKEIIYGCESWWGVIENEEQLKEITNQDIDNVWYVQLLKDMNKKEEGNE